MLFPTWIVHWWSSDFLCNNINAPQTKILEGVTKDEICAFEVLFYGVSTRFGRRRIEKSIENPHFMICSSVQNRRLGTVKFMPPKRRFWKGLQKMKHALSRFFSMLWVVNQKSTFHLLFIVPKSSFGEHKVGSFRCTFQGCLHAILTTIKWTLRPARGDTQNRLFRSGVSFRCTFQGLGC